MVLPPWDDQIFDFGWDPYGPSIDQCSPIYIGMNDRKTASVRSQKPYAVYILAGGYVPQQANTTIQRGGLYEWIPNIPLGLGPHILYITDAAGYTGGTSLAFQTTANSTCTPQNWTPNELAYSVFGDPNQCGTMAVTMNNGTAPYKFQTIVGERPPKTTMWSSSQMTYVVDLNISEEFFLVITDAEGKVAVSGIYTVGAGLTSTCYNVATTLTVGIEGTSTYSTSVNTFSASASSTSTSAITSSSSLSDNGPINTGTLVGAVVGSVVFVALLVGLGIFLCLRRRPKKKPTKIDLSADERRQESPPSVSIFAPFEYEPVPLASTTEDASEYSRGSIPSSPGARVTSSVGSQAMLWPLDSTRNNPHSPYSMYSRDTTTSASQWGEILSARNSATLLTPRTSAVPSVPPIQEKGRLMVMTNATEGVASSPPAVNRLPPGAASPPPYSPK